MDATNALLDTKLLQLQFARDRTEKITQSAKRDAVERQINALKELSGEADQVKRKLEGLKIAAKENAEEVRAWSDQIEAQIAAADEDVSRLREWIESVKMEKSERLREDELRYERKLYETRLHFETELKKAKCAQGQESGDLSGAEGAVANPLEAKLPKLVITKFNGTFRDWPRFWAQFSESIDKAAIAGVTKFSYLKELLVPKARASVEALPFSSEGYMRAISILKDKYGKDSEIVKAYNKEILELPVISGVNVKKIHEFTDRLTFCVQSLETMGKLDQVNGNVSMTLDKLPAIRGDLVLTDDNWENWDFVKFSEALRLWTRRNPIDVNSSEKPDLSPRRREKFFNARMQDHKNDRDKQSACVYCDDKSHAAWECTKISTFDERKRFLAQHRLCFNCTRGNHPASKCGSKASCQRCGRRHHTSICEQTEPPKQEVALTSAQQGDGIFPVVNVKVNGIECRALIDTGAGSSYVSAKLIDLLKIKPVDVKVKQVDMLLGTSLSRLETYETCVQSVCGNFKMDVNLIKVNKVELLTLENPNYHSVIAKYPAGLKCR